VVGDRGEERGVSGAIFSLERLAAGGGVEDIGVGVALILRQVADQRFVGGAEVFGRHSAQEAGAAIDLGLEALMELGRGGLPRLGAAVQGEEGIGRKRLDGGPPILALEGAHEHAHGDIGRGGAAVPVSALVRRPAAFSAGNTGCLWRRRVRRRH